MYIYYIRFLFFNFNVNNKKNNDALTFNFILMTQLNLAVL